MARSLAKFVIVCSHVALHVSPAALDNLLLLCAELAGREREERATPFSFWASSRKGVQQVVILVCKSLPSCLFRCAIVTGFFCVCYQSGRSYLNKAALNETDSYG